MRLLKRWWWEFRLRVAWCKFWTGHRHRIESIEPYFGYGGPCGIPGEHAHVNHLISCKLCGETLWDTVTICRDGVVRCDCKRCDHVAVIVQE
jgi:hypothetical protein